MSTQLLTTPDELIFQRLLEHQDEQLAGLVKNQALQKRLRVEINSALDQIADPTVYEIAETVFSEIVRVFGRLTLIETNLHKLDTLLENLSLLDVLQYEIHNFVDFLENEAMKSDAVNGQLHDVLDG